MNYRNTLGGFAATMLAAHLFSASAADFGGEVLSNADIIGLARAGVTQDLILSKIRSSNNTFDLSTRGMITLKENGVSDELIRAMMAAAQSPAARPTLDQTRFSRELESVASGTPDVRSAGIAWIVANREQSLPALRQSLTDPRPETRMAALAVFARLSDRDSLPAIRNLLTDPVAGVRAAAAQTLAQLNDATSIAAAEQAVTRQLNPMDGYARLLGYARLTQAAGALGNVAAANASALNRIAAVWALGEIGRAGVAGRPALERALTSDSDPEVRREAALAVAKLHDAASAKLLQDACRTDPEVRKVTLSAMAEYPESVEFLISVMSLGADQIAADELETARASLYRLTGQDFGMDGSRWSEWFARNRTQFGAVDIPAFAAAPATASPTPRMSDPDPFFGIPGTPAGQPRTSTPQVDLEAWSIVADSSAIPMAPMPEQQQTAPAAPGWPSSPPGTGVSASTYSSAPAWPSGAAGSASEPPMFLSPGDFGDSPSTAGQFGGSGQAATLRTWSSEPDRPAPAPSATAARSTPAAPSPGVQDTWSSGDTFDFFGPSAPTGETAFGEPDPAAAYASPPPSAPAVQPQPPVVSRAPAEAPSGISLPLPGMDASPPASSYSESPPAPSAPSFFDAPDDMFSSPGFDSPDSFATAPSVPQESAASLSPFGDDSWDSFSDSPSDMLYDDAMSGVGLPEPADAMPDDPYSSDWQETVATPTESTITGGSALYESVPPPPAMSATETPDPAMAESAVPESIFDSGLFVEPEPGQQVVGSPLFGPGSPATSADGSVVYSAPSATVDWPGGATTIASEPSASLIVTPPGGTVPATPVPAVTTTPPPPASTTRTPPPATTAPTTIDSRFITPGTSEPVQMEDEQPRRRGLFGRRQPRQPERQAPADLPRDYVVTPPPPQPAPQVQEQEPLQPTGNEYFTDPSVPLPPVRSTGNVAPRAGQDMPPMLGEGMF